jgi:hypothetical protein
LTAGADSSVAEQKNKDVQGGFEGLAFVSVILL